MIFSKWLSPSPAPLSAEESAELKNVCSSVATRLHAFGHPAKAFSGENFDPPHDFKDRLKWLQIYDEVLALHALEKPLPKGHKELIWKFLGKTRLIPTADIFDRILDEDYIEIYDIGGDQIFRSLNYFDIVSFLVEDLVYLNWKRDFKRSSKVNLGLLALTARFATGYFRKTYDCVAVPVHLVQERIAGQYSFELQLKYISPLRRNNECAALIAVSKARRAYPA